VNGSTLARAQKLAQAARPFRSLIALCVAYECSRFAFCALSHEHGLLQGVSVVDVGTLLLGAWLLVLRFALLFFVPAAVVYRMAIRISARYR
jgi:hypothetical protein